MIFNFLKKPKTNDTNIDQKTTVIGVYAVPRQKDVHLIEVSIQAKPSEIDVAKFTQPDPKVPRLNWQVAYDDHFLNEDGAEIIGDSVNLPATDTLPSRLVFFLYFVDVSKPMLTPFGQVSLAHPTPMPKRLASIITFEEVD